MLAGDEMLVRCERRREKLGRQQTWRGRARSSGWLYLPKRRYGLGGRIWWSTGEFRDAGRLVKCDQAQLEAGGAFRVGEVELEIVGKVGSGSAAWAGHHGVPDVDEGEARERCLTVGDEQ